MSDSKLEEGTQLQIDWAKLETVAATGQGVVPAVAQDVATGAIAMLGYVNEQALAEAFKRRCAVFWSTSRNELWIKGATSGEILELVEVRVNCEQNSLLYRVRVPANGGACHTQADGQPRFGCYYRIVEAEGTLRFAADGGRTMPS
jgi:phosphoribosyl-AMP cyclohydrolase